MDLIQVTFPRQTQVFAFKERGTAEVAYDALAARIRGEDDRQHAEFTDDYGRQVILDVTEVISAVLTAVENEARCARDLQLGSSQDPLPPGVTPGPGRVA